MSVATPVVLALQDTYLATQIAAAFPHVTIDPTPCTYAAIADMVDAGATRWDACLLDAPTCALLGRAGLLTMIDWLVVSRAAAPAADAVPWWGVPAYLDSFVIAYDRAALPGPATASWAAFWNPAIPGKRIVPTAVTGVCESALLGRGVPSGRLYPIDAGSAFACMGKLRGRLLPAATEADAMHTLAAGAAPMAFLRATSADALGRATGGRIGVTWPQAIRSAVQWAIPKEPPAGAGAMRFIAATEAAPTQIDLLRRAGCGPVNPAATRALTPGLMARDPGAPAHRAIGAALDAAWYLDNMRWLQPLWTALLTG